MDQQIEVKLSVSPGGGYHEEDYCHLFIIGNNGSRQRL